MHVLLMFSLEAVPRKVDLGPCVWCLRGEQRWCYPSENVSYDESTESNSSVKSTDWGRDLRISLGQMNSPFGALVFPSAKTEEY